MGQKLRKDKITTLQNSGGNIILPAGARITIGGQQFVTSSNIQVAANLSSSNTRYQVFAVLNSGAMQLIVSENENSVGPVGYQAWKLVGSYYTNGNSPTGFGAFVNIQGSPMSGTIDFLPELLTTGVAATLGSGGNFAQEGQWTRHGSTMRQTFLMRFGSSGVNPGSGIYEFSLLGYNRNDTALIGNTFKTVGTGQIFDNSANNHKVITMGWADSAPADTSRIRSLIAEIASSAITLTPTSPFAFATSDIIRAEFEIEIAEWDTTPIEDL